MARPKTSQPRRDRLRAPGFRAVAAGFLVDGGAWMVVGSPAVFVLLLSCRIAPGPQRLPLRAWPAAPRLRPGDAGAQRPHARLDARRADQSHPPSQILLRRTRRRRTQRPDAGLAGDPQWTDGSVT